MTGGEGYAQRHLQQSDYYDQNRNVEGHWQGRGAELLGLKGEVTSQDFEAVRQGLDPRTGEFLRQRNSADRIASDGAEQSKARSLYDMTFSAPKSVSVMAIVGCDERLVGAHETAIREALGEAEKYSATRVRWPERKSNHRKLDRGFLHSRHESSARSSACRRWQSHLRRS